MALIRCPNCDTLHELEGTFLAKGPRKVRCAECRTIWEAEAIDPAGQGFNDQQAGPSPLAASIPDEGMAFGAEMPATAAPFAADSLTTGPAEPASLDQSAIDNIDFSLPPEPAAEDRIISADELDALFAEEPPAKAAATADLPLQDLADAAARAGNGRRATDPKPAVEDAIIVPASSRAPEPDPATSLAPGDEPDDRRANRRSRRLAAADAHHRHEVAAATGRRSMTGMLLAAGIGSLAVLGILRHETVRLFPQTAPVFAAVGLGVKQHLLDIDDVRSKLSRENGLETLEVTGTITNLTRSQQKIPVLRLSIRSAQGQEIYVWTATTDPGELAPGEKTTFRRRLASPPADSHSVMVRFVAKDDIVAAIR